MSTTSPKITPSQARTSLSRILVPRPRALSTQNGIPNKSKAANFTLPQLLKQSFSQPDQNQTATNDCPPGLKASKSINKSSENLYRIINVQKVNEFVEKSRKRPTIIKSFVPHSPQVHASIDFIDEEPEPFRLDDDGKSEFRDFNLYKRRSKHTASSINITTATSSKYLLPVSPVLTYNPSKKIPTSSTNLSPLYKLSEEAFALDKLETHKTQEQSLLSLEKRNSAEYSPKKPAESMNLSRQASTGLFTSDFSPSRKPTDSGILTRQASTGMFNSDMSPSRKLKEARSNSIYTFDKMNGFSLKHSLQKKNTTLSNLDGIINTQEDFFLSPSRQSLSPEKKNSPPHDPLSNLVKFEDGKIPFHLALNAEARRKMIDEVKKRPDERADLSSIMDLRDKKIPEATKEFLGKLTDVETRKIEGDFRSRSPQRNTIYHLHALDKKTKTRVMAKLQKNLTRVSRYLNS